MIIPLKDALPGDLVGCHSKGFVGSAIRFIEHGGEYNHIAWLDHQDAAGEWTIGQAVGKGVTCESKLSTVAPGGSYVILQAPAEVNRGRALAFARAQVGAEYGFVECASIVATLYTPKFVNVMKPNTWICSAVGAEMWRAGGWVHNWPDIYQVLPQQLVDAALAESGLPLAA